MNRAKQRVLDYLRLRFGDELAESAWLEHELIDIAARAAAMVERSGLSRREIAARMGHKSASVVQRVVDRGEAHNMTIGTLLKLARACKHQLTIQFHPSQQALWSSAEGPATSTPLSPPDIPLLAA